MKKISVAVVISGLMMSYSVTNAAHIHAFPSIDRPDKDLILIRENFNEDIEKDNKYIFTDGTIGYEIYFLMPGGVRDTKNTKKLNKGSILATKGKQQDFRYEWRN